MKRGISVLKGLCAANAEKAGAHQVPIIARFDGSPAHCLGQASGTRWARFLGSVGFLVIWFIPPGLPWVARAETGLHLHDAAKLKAVQEIHAALTNIQLGSVVTQVRSNLHLLATHEQKLVDQENALIRDASLFAALTTTQSVAEYLQGRLIRDSFDELIGGHDDLRVREVMTGMFELRDKLQGAAGNARRVEYELRRPPPDSTLGDEGHLPEVLPEAWVQKLSASEQLVATNQYRLYRQRTTEAMEALNRLATNSGRLGTAIAALRVEARKLGRWSTDALQAERELKAALKAYKDASQSAVSVKDISAKYREFIGRLRSLATNANPIASRVGLEEQLSAVTTLLSATATGAVTNSVYHLGDKDHGTAVAIAAQLPGLLDAAVKVEELRRRLPLSGLLLNKQLLELKLEAAQERLAIQRERLACRTQQIWAIVREVEYLQAADSALRDQDLFRQRSTRDLLSDRNTERRVRDALVQGLLSYANSIRVGQLDYDRQDAQLRHLDYQQSALQSENAIQQWERLVRVPIDNLLDHFNGGFKSDEVADTLVHALGLAAIAWRL